jgi:hypothetical protein
MMLAHAQVAFAVYKVYRLSRIRTHSVSKMLVSSTLPGCATLSSIGVGRDTYSRRTSLRLSTLSQVSPSSTVTQRSSLTPFDN